jgi:hypothetical protein
VLLQRDEKDQAENNSNSKNYYVEECDAKTTSKREKKRTSYKNKKAESTEDKNIMELLHPNHHPDRPKRIRKAPEFYTC